MKKIDWPPPTTPCESHENPQEQIRKRCKNTNQFETKEGAPLIKNPFWHAIYEQINKYEKWTLLKKSRPICSAQ